MLTYIYDIFFFKNFTYINLLFNPSNLYGRCYYYPSFMEAESETEMKLSCSGCLEKCVGNLKSKDKPHYSDNHCNGKVTERRVFRGLWSASQYVQKT